MRLAVALGSNLEPRMHWLRFAETELRIALAGASSFQASPVYESDPLDCPPDSHPFLNAVILVHLPDLDPMKILSLCQEIERRAGRAAPGQRPRNAPRTLDLDLICGDGLVHNTPPDLIIPHPEMTRRRFVLEPLAAIAPDMRPLPGGRTITEFLAALPAGEVLRQVTDAVAWPLGPA